MSLNHHFGKEKTAVFLDPPYMSYEKLYGASTSPVAKSVADWAREHAHLRVVLCGHVGDYDLPGWDVVQWDRGRPTYGGSKTAGVECVWYSPACLAPGAQVTPIKTRRKKKQEDQLSLEKKGAA